MFGILTTCLQYKYLKKTAITIYFLLSSILFIWLIKTAPPVRFDAFQYNDLADRLIHNHLDIFTTDFGNRTFVYPLFLSLIKLADKAIRINYLYLVFFFQLILFHLTNLLIYLSIKQKLAKASVFFLILSGLNIITLSFTNVLLTENLSIFFTTLTFYLLLKNKNWKILFLLGTVSGLQLFTRPSSISLSAIVFIALIYELIHYKKIKNIVFFLIGFLIIFTCGLINTYETTHENNFFNKSTENIYQTQVEGGSYVLKYETSVQSINPTSQMIFYNPKAKASFNHITCNNEAGCIIAFLRKDPISYITTDLVHLFNMYDRVYVGTYVEDIFNPNTLLQLFNYLILSSSIVFMLFEYHKFKNKKIINFALLVIFGIIVIYLPIAVEPRFSAPTFPLLLMFCSIYLDRISSKFNIKYILLNLVFIALFFIISQLVNLQLTLGGVPAYK